VLDALDEARVPVAGLFEKSPHPAEFHGQPVKPLEALARLASDCVVVMASLAPAIELEATLSRVRALFAGRVLCLEQLLDLATLFKELSEPLDYKYDAFVLEEWCRHLDGETSPWHYLPPGFSLEGRTVLEFGPFEAHFSMMLMTHNPGRVIALEGRADNFAKTAVLKAYLDWPNYTLRFGDMHLLRELVPEPVDVIFCSGVLYHSEKPWWFLKSCMDKCDTLILSTHVASEHSPKPRRFKEVELETGPCRFEIFAEGGDNLSGLSGHSLWFSEEDLERFGEHHGFRYEKFNEWVNPHGLWICSLLTRR